MRKLTILIWFFGFFKMAYGQFAFELQSGDILFQDLNCGPLCDAIESVTSGVDGRDFSHCGIAVIENNQIFVIEAIGPGVIKTPIRDFLIRSNDTSEVINVVVGRLKEKYSRLICGALDAARSLLGKGYDDGFVLNNDTYYCSELIYESFKKANSYMPFFPLNEMTFKDPVTKEFDPAWIEYYEKLGRQIPEKELGINPGLISRCEAIYIVK